MFGSIGLAQLHAGGVNTCTHGHSCSLVIKRLPCLHFVQLESLFYLGRLICETEGPWGREGNRRFGSGRRGRSNQLSRLPVDSLVIRLQDDGFARTQIQQNTLSFGHGFAYFTCHRIKQGCVFEINRQRHHLAHIIGCQIGNEVVVAGSVAAAYGAQSVFCAHRLWFCGLFHLSGVDAVDDVGTLCL